MSQNAITELIEMAESPKKTVQVRVDHELIRRVTIIAGDRGLSVTDYLREVLTPVVDRDFKATAAKLSKEAGK